MVGKKPSMHELITFGYDIYPITSSTKRLYGRTVEESFMGYTNIRATMKWRDSRTKKLKYYSYEKFDEHNNMFDKGWSPGSELTTGKNISTLTTLKTELSDHLSSNMIHLMSMLISHHEVLILVSFHNTASIIKCHIFPSKKIPWNHAVPYIKGLMFVSLAFIEKNQQQPNKLWKLYQVNN